MTHVAANVIQSDFRFRADSGNEATPTWLEAVNTNRSQDVDTNFRYRAVIAETAGGASTGDYVLYYSLNSGAYAAVTASSPIQFATFTGSSDGDATTQQIGAGSFVAGELDSNATVAAISLTSQETEMEYCLTIDSAQVVDTDTIDLQVYDGTTALDGYTNTGRVTVIESGVIITGSGTPQADTATSSGAGVVSSLGSGTPQADTATSSGAGDVSSLGDGTPQADTATSSGAGDVSPGFPTGWGRAVKISSDNLKVIGSGSHTDLVCLVALDNIPVEAIDTGSNSALNGGGDIRFSSDAAGVTQLSCEIVAYVTNATAGSRKCTIFVKIPSLSTSIDTDVHMWYNKTGESQPSVTDTYGRNAVWSGELAAYHLDDTVDSTGNGNTLTQVNGATTAPSKIGDGASLDGTNDHLTGLPDYNIAKGSIRHWFKADTLRFQVGIYVSDGTASNDYNGFGGTPPIMEIHTGISDSKAIATFQDGPTSFGASSQLEGTTNLVAGTDYHFAMTWDKAGFVRLYLDGVEEASYDVSGVSFSNIAATVKQIGRTGDAQADRHWDGLLDEGFIRDNEQLSSDWLKTEYNNQNDPATFWTTGTPFTPGIITGSGTPQADTATSSGAGVVSSLGDGTPQADTATSSGVGVVSSLGDGTPQADTATSSGAGVVSSLGDGTPQADTATSSGAGVVSGPISGDGTPQADTATSSGAGVVSSLGDGTPQADTATSSGVGVVSTGITGSGTPQADTATSIGVGVVSSLGNGTPQADTATSSGAGVVSSLGSGTPQADTATSSGAGVVSSLGSGTPQADTATSSGIGSGGGVITGSGTPQAETATAAGIGILITPDAENITLESLTPVITLKSLTPVITLESLTEHIND